MTSAPDRLHILTVALEDYFQVGAFNRFVQRNQWYRFETRLERNTDRTLALLARHGAKATFFALGWVAARFPELLRRVADAGHEVAVKGYYHRGIREMTPAEFEADAARAKAAAEAATGRAVVGYRLADGWLGPDDLWALDRLAAAGFAYDSSIAPLGRAFAGQPFRRFPHPHDGPGRTLWEVPVSTAPVLGARLPVIGGNYLRQLPEAVSRRAAARWARSHPAPLVGYFHVWELDPDQPRLAVGGPLTRLRHYRNLHRMEDRLGRLLSAYRFTSAADYLGLPAVPVGTDPTARPDDSGRLAVVPAGAADRTPVTVVVPCFNEEDVVPYLAKTLDRVAAALGGRYDVRFVLVDDASTDRTWDALSVALGGRRGFTLLRHDVNGGVAAAIGTGLRHADTDIVCSMDCDCTYDPLELARMIPLLAPGVDLVTASPYHPAGHVRNVPGWRLLLSRGASWLYRRVLPTKLHTYTSCFRVYRKSAVVNLPVRDGRFLGIAELLGRLLLAGGTAVEHPATLEVRMLGRSKLKTARTVLGHLGLMARLVAARARGWQPAVLPARQRNACP